MRIFMASVALGALAIAPLQADPGGGKGGGNGNGGGNGKAQASAGGNGNGGGNPHAGHQMQGSRGQGQAKQGGNGKAERGQAQRQVERQMRAESPRRIVQDVRGPGNGGGQKNGNGKQKQDWKQGGGRTVVEARGADMRGGTRVMVRDNGGSGPVRVTRRVAGGALIEGCPPGLAKKGNGCMPPGLARQQQAVVTTAPWQQPDWYGSQWYGDRYRYYDGYMLRLGSNDSIISYVPLLGGALAIGEVWPTTYQQVAVPDYYRTFYDLGPADSYRYHDDAIYGVDQGDDLITSVIALLTGDTFNVGDVLPAGYDVYNVPYEYRDQYVDGPDAMYRYSDGYVYEVDPTTQLVQAAIQLLTA